MKHIVIALLWLLTWQLLVSEYISLSGIHHYKGKYYKAFNIARFIVYIPIFSLIFNYTYDFPSLSEIAKRIAVILFVELLFTGFYLIVNKKADNISYKSILKLFEYNILLFLTTLFGEFTFQGTFYSLIFLG